MTDLSQRIRAELENIDEIFTEIPQSENLHKLSSLELAGTAAYLHNFYNGIENILKQIFSSKNIEFPLSASWHKELLESAVTQNILSAKCKENLAPYLAFRHFFSHAYALDLHPYKMEPLVLNLNKVYEIFRNDIAAFI